MERELRGPERIVLVTLKYKVSPGSQGSNPGDEFCTVGLMGGGVRRGGRRSKEERRREEGGERREEGGEEERGGRRKK